jgi:hypothetical protein
LGANRSEKNELKKVLPFKTINSKCDQKKKKTLFKIVKISNLKVKHFGIKNENKN